MIRGLIGEMKVKWVFSTEDGDNGCGRLKFNGEFLFFK